MSHGDCANLLRAASADRAAAAATPKVAGKAPAENPLTTLLPAVKGLLPTAPDRLAVGVARVVERAEREAAAFAELRDKALADSKKGPTSAATVDHRKSDLAAAQWGLQEYQTYGAEGLDLPRRAPAFGLAVPEGGSRSCANSRGRSHNWFPMLEKLPLRCWQTYWRAQAAKASQKDGGEIPWLEFLKLWHELGIAGLPGRFALMEGLPRGCEETALGRIRRGVSMAGRPSPSEMARIGSSSWRTPRLATVRSIFPINSCAIRRPAHPASLPASGSRTSASSRSGRTLPRSRRSWRRPNPAPGRQCLRERSWRRSPCGSAFPPRRSGSSGSVA